MVKPIKNIGLYLIAIILIPILFFIAREIYSLSENEAVIEKIYQSQIESLLFSVNQYSEDMVRSWGMKLESENTRLNKNDAEIFPKTKSLFESNKAIQNIFFADNTFSNKVFEFSDNKVVSKINLPEIEILLKKNQSLLEKLNQYKINNFTKFEPLTLASSPKTQILIFMLNDGRVCGISFDKSKFVRENLSAKIQSISGDEFSVSVYDSTLKTSIYSTAYLNQNEFVQIRKLWLIPSYSLGISLQGKSLQDILRNRTYSGIILISILAAMMLLVAWFGYKNIKKEIELAQIKNEFVSNVSHELRTPLALINMFAETLFMGRVKSEEKRNEYYGIIQQETERLSKIVNKILSFSKIEAGKWKFIFTMVDLNALAEKIFFNYKFHLENKGFMFKFESSGDILNANLDAEAVTEALINLVDNAVKYSDDRKSITIRTGREKDFIFIEVEDLGLGISDEDHKRVFEKFYRAQSGNIHNTKGTGLGLTLVKHIMDAHSGKIKLHSTLNKGSIFRLTFPLKKIS